MGHSNRTNEHNMRKTRSYKVRGILCATAFVGVCLVFRHTNILTIVPSSNHDNVKPENRVKTSVPGPVNSTLPGIRVAHERVDISEKLPPRSNASVDNAGESRQKRRTILYACRIAECGGWADRQKGVVSAYVLSVLLDRDFKLDMPRPCDVSVFMLPDQVNWTLAPNETHGKTTKKLFGWTASIAGLMNEAKKLGDFKIPGLDADYVFITWNLEMVNLLQKNSLARRVPWLDLKVQLKISGVLTEIQLSCYNVHDEELERRHSALAKLLEGWQNTTSLGMNHAGPVSLSPKNIADTDEPDLGLTLPDEKLAARVKQLKSELFAIFDGTKESDRHKLYCRGGVSRRSLDGYGGLGYLQEGQEDLVMDILLSLFSKHGTLSLNFSVAEIYNYVLRKLFKPVPDLRAKMIDLQRSRPQNTKLVCAQVRMGLSQHFDDEKQAKFNTMDSLPVLWNFLRPYNDSANYRVFFASDNEDMMHLAKEKFPTVFLSTPGPVTHLDKYKGPGDNACAGFGHTILDQMVLSTCDVLIMSRSGFGKVASFLRNTDQGLFLFHQSRIVPFLPNENFADRVW